MSCETIQLPNGLGTAVICGLRGAPKCWRRCGNLSKYQCDFPVGEYKSGKRKGQNRDCNLHLCENHARHGITPGVDFCEMHFPLAKAAYERKQQRTLGPASAETAIADRKTA